MNYRLAAEKSPLQWDFIEYWIRHHVLKLIHFFIKPDY